MVRLFLDDERDPREWLPHMGWWRGRDLAELEEWAWAKTALEAIEMLRAGNVVEVSLDHDLGEDADAGTGYDVLVWIEEQVALDGYEPPLIHIHTSNPSARDRMESAARAIEKLAARSTST